MGQITGTGIRVVFNLALKIELIANRSITNPPAAFLVTGGLLNYIISGILIPFKNLRQTNSSNLRTSLSGK
jgi:hypothetical protein